MLKEKETDNVIIGKDVFCSKETYELMSIENKLNYNIGKLIFEDNGKEIVEKSKRVQ